MPFGKDEARAVFDFINRHQLYLEGVKNWYVGDFLRYVKNFRAKLFALLRKQNVERLSEMTKRTFLSLLKRVDSIKADDIAAWTQEFGAEVRRFARIDTILQRAGMAAKTGADVTTATVGSVWNKIKDETIPAFGKTIKQSIGDTLTNARARMQQALRRSQADNLTIEETIAAIDGEGPEANYKTGTLSGLVNEGKSVISTTLQYVSTGVTQFVGKLVSACYIWSSIIDSVTSRICRERNGTVYRWGAGPLPPAHPNCRSRPLPWPCGEPPDVPTFNAWIRGQARGILTDVYGLREAERIIDQENGDVANFLKGKFARALTLDEFEAKTDTMVNGKV